MQKWGALCLVLALSLHASAASAASFGLDSPPSSVPSDNGLLEFSNFEFFSPGGSVDAGEVTATTTADGIVLSGPVTSTGKLKSFFVSYDVTATGPGIIGASLLLDSSVDADIFGLVVSTKRILGERGDPHGPPHGGGGHWGGHGNDWDDDDWDDDWDRHGSTKDDWWRDRDDDWERGWDEGGYGRDDRHRGRDFGHARGMKHGHGHDFPVDRKTLAFLKTVDWELRFGCFHPRLGLGRDGAIRLVEAGFEAQQTIRVVEHVLVIAKRGSATWESSTNSFPVVPEPGAAGLTLLGLVLMALRSRRR
jgi:hypothetical protein